MDRLTSMAVFVKAADLGSFAAAATELDLSAVMVGKHIRFLEERLGVRLINRTTRRHTLSKFGRAYYERCKTILAEAEAADALAADELTEPRGRLRVTMPVHFGRHCVLPALLALKRRHPQLELDLSFGDRLADLAEGHYDLAIRTGTLANQAGVMTRRVARQAMVVCAAPSYLKRVGRPAALADLAEHEAVVYRRSGPAAPWLFPRAGGAPIAVTPRARLYLDDLEAIVDAAVAGEGLIWSPLWLVRERIARKELTRLLPDQPTYLYDVHALWLQAPHLPRRTRLAVDALATALPAMMR